MIINNVRLVLENEVVDGSVEVHDGVIRAFAETQSRTPEAMDGEGGWLLPGLIELHTDNLDKFFTPRPKVDWPAHSAMSSHDALMVASGITTVLDAVAIGDVRDGGDRLENLEKMINAVEETQKRGLNRAEHRLHLRCELPHHTTLPLFEKLVGREPVSLVSLMDHSPGVGQYRDVIKNAGGPTISVSDWRQRNETFFNVLSVERNVMFIILSLIVLVAALNIISGLMMLVKDKGRDIAILRTMGATKGAVMRIFLITGASIGIVGTLAGLVIGVVFCWNIDAIKNAVSWISGTTVFDPSVYYLTKLPAEINPHETGGIVLMALALSVLATIYPSWKASRLDPVEALRYE